ncbi:MAG: hypothetical protein ACYDC8_03690 [Gammaproteobacteria bacterium]
MLKLIPLILVLLAVIHYAGTDLSSIVHLKDYAEALLIAVLAQPWLVRQFDG